MHSLQQLYADLQEHPFLPGPYYSIYNPDDIPMDPAFNETFGNKPVHKKHVSRMWGVNKLPWEEWQKIIAQYYGYITLIDKNIDSVFRLFKREGIVRKLIDSIYG